MFRGLLTAVLLAAATPTIAQPATKPAIAAERTPDFVAESFFRTLQTGNVLQAYDDMWRGTLMSKKQGDVENIAAQTETALRLYGKVIGWEKVKSEQISPSYKMDTYLLRADGAPLFFRFHFYHSGNGWVVAWLNFADNYNNLPK